MDKGPEVGKQRARVRSSTEFCFTGAKGGWREYREIRLAGRGLEGQARKGREQGSFVCFPVSFQLCCGTLDFYTLGLRRGGTK